MILQKQNKMKTKQVINENQSKFDKTCTFSWAGGRC